MNVKQNLITIQLLVACIFLLKVIDNEIAGIGKDAIPGGLVTAD